MDRWKSKKRKETNGYSRKNRPAAWRGALFVFALGLLGIAAVFQPPKAQPAKAPEMPPSLVVVDAVRAEETAQTLPVIGRLVALRAGEVATRIDGRVGQFLVEVGDRVKKGDAVAVLDSDRRQREHQQRLAAVAESKAALDSAKATLAIDEQEFYRLQSLRESTAFPKARYEDKQQEVVRAQSAVAQAAAAVENATALLRLAELTLEDAKIRAPYDGVISLRHIEVGAYAKSGAPIVSMVNDTNLEIEADVPAQRLTGLQPGTLIKVEFDNQKTGFAAVRAIVPEENPLTRTRRVRFVPDLDTRKASYAVGQSAILQLPVDRPREVVTVHKDAIVKRAGATLVFVIANGQAQIRPVAIGKEVGNRFEVLSGLKAGEAVVIRGNERLLPGQKVLFEEKS